MATLAEFRQKYPQYDDLNDEQLAGALHQKYYSNMPQDDFFTKIGFKAYDPLSSVQAPAPQTTAKGLVKSAGEGIWRGLTAAAGLPGDALSAIDYGLKQAPTMLGFPAREEPELGAIGRLAKSIEPPTRQQVRSFIEPVSGPAYQPKTPAEKMTATVTEFGTGALAGPGPLGRRLLTQGALPGVTSETAGQLTEGTPYEPVARTLGAMTPSGARRAATPIPHDPNRAYARQVLEREGVRPTAGQVTGNKRLGFAESAAFEALGRDNPAAEQFTAATLRRIGETQATRATADVIDQNWSRIGDQFDDIAARNVLVPDRQLMQDAGDTWRDYARVTRADRPRAVQEAVMDIVNMQRQPHLAGDIYQRRRSQLGSDAAATTDVDMKRALNRLRDALDDAMERSMFAAGRGADIQQWRTARRQYGNLMVVRDALKGSQAENAGLGIITPARLAIAASRGPRLNSFSRGQGDFSEMAKAGQAVMTPLPNSGSAARLRTQGVPSAVGGLLGFGATGGDPYSAAAGAIGGALYPQVKGRVVLNPLVQGWLRNNRMPPRPGDLSATQMGLLYGPRYLAPDQQQ
jgi:hypothetical protein